MPIFPRRVLQQIIDRNRVLFSPDELRKLLVRLNSTSLEAMYAEWELVIIDAVKKEFEDIVYEPTLTGKKRLDLIFDPSSDSEERFALEITAITQKPMLTLIR